MITIKEPIWHNLSVGISEDAMTDHIEIEITYKRKDGIRVYPNTYTIPRVVAMRYPVQERRGHRLHIIPIAALVEKV